MKCCFNIKYVIYGVLNGFKREQARIFGNETIISRINRHKIQFSWIRSTRRIEKEWVICIALPAAHSGASSGRCRFAAALAWSLTTIPSWHFAPHKCGISLLTRFKHITLHVHLILTYQCLFEFWYRCLWFVGYVVSIPYSFFVSAMENHRKLKQFWRNWEQ